MPRDNSIKKVLVIGSGPIVIGQAAEFDYAGTQACRSLKEEGIEVVLLNSNPATIMTDKDIADRVYIEPLTVEVVEQLIKKEKPDSVLPTLGGQAGLNLAMELEEAGFLKENGVRLIGTTSETIKKAEDRLEFKATMEKIGEPVAASLVVENVEDGLAFANEIGYPVVLRPAYTLGGSGGGIAHDPHQLVEILENGLRLSRVGQVLVERCIAGWKEIEYEVMRDGNGNCITVCNMENIDPVGVHTGDSIVVAPSQTLGDKEYQMLRTSALNIISELNITGGCNVQYALHPETFEYCVIEVNPRVSRSSALASKATGYPIAKVAAKIALGYNLDEIQNAITKKTYASFEPMLDYVVVKIPRLPFDKFIAIMGPSGSGKTTLMNIIGCLDVASSGVYQLNGTDLKDFDDRTMAQIRNRSIGFVFQTFNLLPKQTALDNVALPLLYSNVSKKERMERAKAALERVGLGDRLDFRPTQLSGGQKQRVAIARAIVTGPDLLLADEPTGALDSVSGRQIMELFSELNQEGMTVLMITHDAQIAGCADRMVMIKDGRLKDGEEQENGKE